MQKRCAQQIEPIELVALNNQVFLPPLTTAEIRLEIDDVNCTVEPNFDQQTLVRVIEAIRSTNQKSC